MQAIPPGVLLLYTANKSQYSIRLYSTTVREFLPDPLLQPKAPEFERLAPLLDREFQVDKTL
jgi:hypothetical protein